MNRAQLEHVIRAAAAIVETDPIVIVGSQAILAAFPDAPEPLLVSREADLFTFRSPRDADLIDGSIGEGSPFHQTFGYYAHGVGEETSTVPPGWKERLVRMEVPTLRSGHVVALALHPEDLAAAKLAAGRGKDLSFLRHFFQARLGDPQAVRMRIATLVDSTTRGLCLQRLERLLAP